MMVPLAACLLISALCVSQVYGQITWVNSMENLQIDENQEFGVVVYTLRATIQGSASGIIYGFNNKASTDITITETNAFFKINQTTGEVETYGNKLNYESDESRKFKVNLIARTVDGSEYSKFVSTVTLNNLNDEVPRFGNDSMSVTIRENTALNSSSGTVVLTGIFVTDPDGLITLPQRFLTVEVQHCLIGGDKVECKQNFTMRQTGVFSTKEYIGEFVVTSQLDFEANSKIQVQLKASDGTYTTNTDVVVNVADVQDSRPIVIAIDRFTKWFDGTLPGAMVINVTAQDQDTGRRPIYYSFSDSQDPGAPITQLFTIKDPLVGQITNVVTLDLEDENYFRNYEEKIVRTNWRIRLSACEIVSMNPLVVGSGPNDCATPFDVEIQIEDVNDNKPIPDQSAYSYKINEDIANGRMLDLPRITIFDRDTEIYNSFRSYLVDPSAEFEISGADRNPAIRIKNTSLIDFDKGPKNYTLMLKTDDIENNTLFSLTTIFIEILDRNDNSPQFSSTFYNVSVMEDAQEGVNLIRVNASDIDSGILGTSGIRFSLSGAYKQLFKIDEVSGWVTVGPCLGNKYGVHPCLDYDHEPINYILTVTARDNNGDTKIGRASSVNLFINTVDVNDNRPTLTGIERFIDEGQIHLDPKLFAKAEDVDATSTTFEYSILSQSPGAFWKIDRYTGEIYVDKSNGEGIKFEEGDTDGKFILTVSVTDGKNSGSGIFTITVVDMNDNKPICFPSSYTGSIYETETGLSGTPILTIKAADKDDPTSENGKLEYNIDNNFDGRFGMNPLTGSLFVTNGSVFDFDKKRSYEILAVVNDKGTPQGTCNATIIITVLDTNNKNPTINPPLKQITLYENHAINTTMDDGTIVASDADADAQLRFEFFDPKNANSNEGFPVNSSVYEYRDLFRVNATTGVIYVNKKLDSIQTRLVSYGVRVSDINANPVQYGFGTIFFRILPFNTQPPVFETFNSPIYLKEEQPIGSVVISLVADDSNGIREYKIIEQPDNFFAISPSTGSVSLFTRVDYDDARKTNDSYFIVQATDNGDPALTATASVSVIFQNINDIWPEFRKANGQQTNVYSARLPENSPDNTFLVQVYASDLDRPDNNSFHEIRFYMDDDRFDVDNMTGEIFVRLRNGAVLDREQSQLILTSVIARDNPYANLNDPTQRQNQRVATISLVLNDENDNPPELSSDHYKAVIYETIGVGTEILQLFSSDPDLGVNAQVYFTKVPNVGTDFLDFFGVKLVSGHLYVTKSVKGHVGTYDFKVQAQDNLGKGFIDTANVTVEVRPAGNSVPRWVIPPIDNMTIEVLEEQYFGMVVYDVLAEDDDKGLNGQIDYSFISEGITTDHTNEFEINSVTGVIHARIIFDREKIGGDRYVLLLKAADRGETPLETTRFLTIIIIDVNDNVPKFSDRLVTFRVDENAAQGFYIGSVSAADIDQNPEIFYHIISGNEEVVFTLGEKSGLLSLAATLDSEKKNTYYLDVQASNNEPDYTVVRNRRRRAVDESIITVKIIVGDINDLAPAYLQANYYGCVSSRAPYDKHIMTVEAVDYDAVGTGVVRYRLMGGHEEIERNQEGDVIKLTALFDIHPKFGVLTNKILMQKYAGRTFEIIVNARDAESIEDSQSTNTTIRIFVTQPGKEVKLLIKQNTRAVRLYQSQLLKTIEQSRDIDYMCILDIEDHLVDSSGSVSTLWSDVYVSGIVANKNADGVRTSGFTILSGTTTRNIITNEMYIRENDFNLLYIKEVEVASSSQELEIDNKTVLIVLIIIAVLIFLIIVFCIVAFMCIRAAKHQKKQLLLHKTHATPAPMIAAEPEPVVYDNRAYIVEQKQPPQEQRTIETEPVHVQYAVVQRREQQEYRPPTPEPVDDQEVIVVELQDDEPRRTVVSEGEYRIETEVEQD